MVILFKVKLSVAKAVKLSTKPHEWKVKSDDKCH